LKEVNDTAGAECLETCKLGTVEGKTRKGLPIPAGSNDTRYPTPHTPREAHSLIWLIPAC
jgi:hypothetical protein